MRRPRSAFTRFLSNGSSKTPDALALLFEEQQLTYQELNQRANQLARLLHARGVGPEIRVGISLTRSIEMVIAILGVLKAGGAYVPLDPSWPAKRLEFVLLSSQVSLLLTFQPLIAMFSSYKKQILCLDTDWAGAVQRSTLNLDKEVQLCNLAYVIYTSGSTGEPKGVLLEHQGLNNLIETQKRTFTAGPGSRILQFAALSFDASIWEIGMSLGTGAILQLAPQEMILPGEPLLQVLQEKAITHVTLPPSVLTLLPVVELVSLQAIILAGEICPAELVARWGKSHRIFNAYGPTEGTVCATIARCSGREQKPWIGRPISHTQVYLLDRYFQPVPLGVPGEIYLGGVNLARGYLGRADLTAERFIPHPFSSEPGMRLYQTGDRARYLANGEIDFLARADRQMKLRGFRIELDEIETVLQSHPAVCEAVVIARETTSGETRLVAYVTAQENAALTPEGLRQVLRERLPGYMVPLFFLILEAMPLTSNGKLDRSALPAPESQHMALAKAPVMPRTMAEKRVSEIWSELLGIERIGIHDDFFEIGGHSLLALRLVTRIQTTLGQHLPLLAIFQGRTIETLARILDEPQKNFSQSPLITLQAGDSRTPFFCVHPAGGNTMCYVSLARALGSEPAFLRTAGTWTGWHAGSLHKNRRDGNPLY